MQDEFVIQMHSGYGPVHYDLMLQKEETLATWQLSCCPVHAAADKAIAAKRLNNHRTAYLSYEGPVSGERGRVEIVDKGTYELISEDDSRWVIRLHGQCVKGTYELKHTGPGDCWQLIHAEES